MNLVQSVKSGFGGNTGDLLKAARIFKIQITGGDNTFTTSTWTRDQDGVLNTQETEQCTRKPEDPSLRPNSTQPEPVWTPQKECCTIYSKEFDTQAHA